MDNCQCNNQKNEFFSLHFFTSLSFQIFPGFPPRTVQGQGTQKKKVSPAPSFTLHSTKRKIMNVVNVTSINVLDNPCAFGNPFQFEITFECLQELKDDLDWKIIYVGSAESEKYDQELESVLVGPVPVGVNKFVFQAPAPDASKVPENDILGVTVVLVTCSYNEKEFIRVGYYVNNSYAPESGFGTEPPSPPRTDLMRREILAQKPRVTRFPMRWDNEPAPATPNAASPGTDGLAATGFAQAGGAGASSSSAAKSDENDVAMEEDEDMEEDDEEEEEEEEDDEDGDIDLMEDEDL